MEIGTLESPLDRGAIRYRSRELLAQACGWFLAGAVVASLGFIMPWFKHGRDYGWWYSGLELFTSHNLPGGGVLFFGYFLVVLGSFWLLDRDLTWAATAMLLTIAASLWALILVGVSFGDAGTLYVVWNVGLIPLVIGNGTMLVTGTIALMCQLVNRVILGD